MGCGGEAEARRDATGVRGVRGPPPSALTPASVLMYGGPAPHTGPEPACPCAATVHCPHAGTRWRRAHGCPGTGAVSYTLSVSLQAPACLPFPYPPALLQRQG